jgi:hypothetical protein
VNEILRAVQAGGREAMARLLSLAYAGVRRLARPPTYRRPRVALQGPERLDGRGALQNGGKTARGVE